MPADEPADAEWDDPTVGLSAPEDPPCDAPEPDLAEPDPDEPEPDPDERWCPPVGADPEAPPAWVPPRPAWAADWPTAARKSWARRCWESCSAIPVPHSW